MLDAVNVERMGIPSVTIVTEPFVGAARSVAASQGLPDLRLVVIPHDYLHDSAEAIRARLEPVIDQIVAGLFGSA